jgi:transcriptional regulator with XRE-family HTH domain
MKLGAIADRISEGLSDRDFLDRYGTIATQVAERRSALGLSQQELADICGTTQSAIARLESGRRAPRVDTLLRIANALDCELAVELRPRA